MKLILVLALTAFGLLAADATGTWKGTMTPPAKDGVPQPDDTACLVLVQTGNEVTGTAGPRADHQLPIQNGKVVQGNITFDVLAGDNVLKAVLKQEGDRITGTITHVSEDSSGKAVLSLKRETAEIPPVK